MSSDDADKAARKAARAERKAAKAVAAAPVDDASSPPKRKREDSPSSLEAKIAKQAQEEGLLEVDVEAPEPLSKAQARKEAKRAAKRDTAVVDGEDAGTEPPKKKKKVDENAKPKRANSIWIGNLSFKTTPDELKAWFTKELEAQRAKKEESGDAPASELPVRELVTRVNMPMKEGRMPFKQSRGFAYVDFALPSLQRKALRLSEKLLDGRKVLIKMGDDYAPTPDARTPKPLLSIKAGSLPKKMPHGQSSSLFVGNLDFKSTEEELWAHVESNFEALRAPSAFGRDGKRIKKEKKDEDEASGSEESSDEEEEAAEPEVEEPTEDSVEAAAAKLPAKETCGLKKVRMPTFEDSGKCKG